MIKKLIAVLFVVALVPLWIGCGGLPKSAVAQVNDKVITKEDLDKRIEDLKSQYGDQGFPTPDSPQYQQLQQQVVQSLVEEQIILFEADKRGITVSDDEINSQIDQLKQMTGGEDQFNQTLTSRNLTLDRLKDLIRSSLIAQKLSDDVTKDVPPVSDQDAQNFYNSNQSLFQKPETRKVSAILVADQATANQVKAQLDAGGDFAALAKQYSTDASSKNNGGDLGEIPSQNSGYPAEFESAMDALQAGQTSGPVKTQSGYYIIRVQQIIPAGVQPFDQVKDDIKSQLEQTNKQKAFNDWYDSIKGGYNVQYGDGYAPAETATTGAQTDTTGQTQGATTP